ncbi:MAG: aldose 1-epimerase family protein, partial [Candidatus Sumerlaeia bacterium]|nr:aldose 1-epimerase family protein [Candidatus Sumerlaeia bacterium]
FFGGLLITCGLTGVGSPSEDEFGKHGLHGRATALPAEEIAFWNTWIGDNLEMGVQGIMRESAVFGDFLELRRKITSHLGVNSIIIEDIVTNKGHQPSPFMILYHVNLGFPLVSEKAELILATKNVQPRDAEAEKGIYNYNKFDVPQSAFKEQVFFHQLAVDNLGFAEATLVNLELNNNQGLGVNLRWQYDRLPYFTEWKQIGEGTYTVGLEPGNCLPTGRVNEHRAGRLKILQPGEVWQSILQISILENIDQIEAVRKKSIELLK